MSTTPFKQWASISNNDSNIASGVLDRLLHHSETILSESTSFRMQDQTKD
ncbi:MAG TPA: ATP-binding protein [Candidatus Acidoferrum sp.]|nr:ATP-binding protein [Candidatus Acidoferrum sp.]